MSRRAAAVAQTRKRIVDATLELHGEQGIAATSWDDIAARAGVGVGTVYRHFPSLDELVPASGEITMQVLALPGTRRNVDAAVASCVPVLGFHRAMVADGLRACKTGAGAATLLPDAGVWLQEALPWLDQRAARG